MLCLFSVAIILSVSVFEGVSHSGVCSGDLADFGGLAHVIQLRDMVRCRPRRGLDVRVTLKCVLKNEWFPMSRS